MNDVVSWQSGDRITISIKGATINCKVVDIPLRDEPGGAQFEKAESVEAAYSADYKIRSKVADMIYKAGQPIRTGTISWDYIVGWFVRSNPKPLSTIAAILEELFQDKRFILEHMKDGTHLVNLSAYGRSDVAGRLRMSVLDNAFECVKTLGAQELDVIIDFLDEQGFDEGHLRDLRQWLWNDPRFSVVLTERPNDNVESLSEGWEQHCVMRWSINPLYADKA